MAEAAQLTENGRWMCLKAGCHARLDRPWHECPSCDERGTWDLLGASRPGWFIVEQHGPLPDGAEYLPAWDAKRVGPQAAKAIADVARQLVRDHPDWTWARVASEIRRRVEQHGDDR